MFLTETEKTKIKDVMKAVGIPYGAYEHFDYQIWRVVDIIIKDNEKLRRRLEKLEKKYQE